MVGEYFNRILSQLFTILTYINYVIGCHCPCGEEVCPAFYLISSKVELTKAVQNIQKTL